jgi:nicotinate-nucleotide adenylyltransferase
VERLGIFGGTFDPVHVGHLAAACAARHQLRLDRVLLVVAADPWQKHGRVVAPAAARYAMVAAAIQDDAGLEASALEIDRSGPSYTIDTVEQLATSERELFVIVGSDVAASIGTWHRVDALREAATLAIVNREGCEAGRAPDGWRTAAVTMPRLDISSTDLRRRIAAGEPVDYLIPQGAVRVLRDHGLYTA